MSRLFLVLLLQILAKTSAVGNFANPFGNAAVRQRIPFFGNLGAQFGLNWWNNLNNPWTAPGYFPQPNDPRFDEPGKLEVPESPIANYEDKTERPNSEEPLIEKIPLPTETTPSDTPSRPPTFSDIPPAYNLPPGCFRCSPSVPGYRPEDALPSNLPRGDCLNHQPLPNTKNPVYPSHCDEHPLLSQVYECLLRLLKVLRDRSLGNVVGTKPFRYAQAVKYVNAVDGYGRALANELDMYAGRKITFPKIVNNVLKSGPLIKGIGQTIEGIHKLTEKKRNR